MNQLGLHNLDEYRARLTSCPQEWTVLNGMCRITISRFYRDKGVFHALTDIILPAIARRAQEEGREATFWSDHIQGEAFSEGGRNKRIPDDLQRVDLLA